jgi:hypothetical protein
MDLDNNLFMCIIHKLYMKILIINFHIYNVNKSI